MKSRKYCPRCRKVREVIEDLDEILCKHCGHISKKTKHSLKGVTDPAKLEKSYMEAWNDNVVKVKKTRNRFGGVFG
jgi:hypothetical protein